MLKHNMKKGEFVVQCSNEACPTRENSIKEPATVTKAKRSVKNNNDGKAEPVKVVKPKATKAKTVKSKTSTPKATPKTTKSKASETIV
jgi:hypothetical protein